MCPILSTNLNKAASLNFEVHIVINFIRLKFHLFGGQGGSALVSDRCCWSMAGVKMKIASLINQGLRIIWTKASSTTDLSLS